MPHIWLQGMLIFALGGTTHIYRIPPFYFLIGWHTVLKEQTTKLEKHLFKYSVFMLTMMNEIEKIVRDWRSVPSDHPGKDNE